MFYSILIASAAASLSVHILSMPLFPIGTQGIDKKQVHFAHAYQSGV